MSAMTAATGVNGSGSSAPDVSTDGEVVFTARGITKVYQMGEVEVQALRGVDFDLSSREFVVLLGPSGSGKSTLLNILGGLDVADLGRSASTRITT